MPADTVLATWVAPFEAKLSDGTVLEPGVTKVEIGVDEAFDSDHWQPPAGAKRPEPATEEVEPVAAPAAPARVPSAPSPSTAPQE